MTRTPWFSRIGLLAGALATLAACGGGGGNGGGSAQPPVFIGTPTVCTSAAQAVSTAADGTVTVGKAAGAAVAGCSGAIADPVWTQTAGPAVTLLSDKTQAISFEPPQAGTYSFSVSLRDAGGAQRTESVTLTATGAAGASRVVARADHAVRKGGNVSVRAWVTLAAGDSAPVLQWAQTEGPAVTLDTRDPNRILFTAPDVARDTLLRFRVTLRTALGTTDADDVLVLVESHAQAPSDPNGTGPYVFSDIHVSRVYPYRAAGPYAAALARCTFDATLQYTGGGANLCPLSTLPFLHQTTGGAMPTTAQIMDRVLVSHDWMGANFEAFLNSADASDDLKRLFNGVTAIVIGSHVRPSYYYALTGAIYLDADYFWVTAAQADTVNEAPDFRSAFGADLNYSTLWRYTLNNASIFAGCVPLADRSARPASCLLTESGWLLYHELGHASDFMPPSARGTLNSTLSAWGNIAPLFGNRQLPSDALSAQRPLASDVLKGLARVKFFGDPTTLVQRSYTPDDIAAQFSPDGATDDYAYSNSREDTAMLLEEAMMARNHGFRRDFAITDKIVATSTGNNLAVRWGQRGRVGDALVKPRARQAVGALAPWVDLAAVDALTAPLAMRAGESWNANLVLPAPPPGVQVGAFALRAPALSPQLDSLLLARAVRVGSGADARTGSAGHWTPNERWMRRMGVR